MSIVEGVSKRKCTIMCVGGDTYVRRYVYVHVLLPQTFFDMFLKFTALNLPLCIFS